jgi:hypothetical protein
MTVLAGARRAIQKLGPYQSLALLLVPVTLVEPLKLVALVVADEGHRLTGTAMIVGAYAVSLIFVERLFRVIKPKLMTLSWFAKLWTLFVAIRKKLSPWSSVPVERLVDTRNYRSSSKVQSTENSLLSHAIGRVDLSD